MLRKILALVCLFLVFTHGNAQDSTIRIVTSQSEHYSLAGLYPQFCVKYGINVAVKQLPASVYDASTGGFILLERGDADIISAPLGAALIAKSNGLNIFMVSNLASDGIDLIVNSSIKSYKDLKDKKIGMLKGSATVVQVEKKLQEVGLTLKDVTLQYMSFQQMPLALDRGIIDGYVGAYPFTIQSISAGFKSIDNFPTVSRQLFASTTLSSAKEQTLKRCHIDLYKMLNDSSRRDEVKTMIDVAKRNNLTVIVPMDTKYSYKLIPSISDDVIIESLDYFKNENKIRKDFTLPVDFNRTQ